MTTTASAYGDLRHLLPNNYKALISAWLEEDCPSLDYGGFVVGESEAEAELLGKSKVCFFLPPPFDQIGLWNWQANSIRGVGNCRGDPICRRGVCAVRVFVRLQPCRILF